GSAVERAYRRGDLFDKRRKLMEAWADFCASVGCDRWNRSMNDALVVLRELNRLAGQAKFPELTNILRFLYTGADPDRQARKALERQLCSDEPLSKAIRLALAAALPRIRVSPCETEFVQLKRSEDLDIAVYLYLLGRRLRLTKQVTGSAQDKFEVSRATI